MSEKVVVELDQYEHRAVASIINDRRKDMLSKNKDVEFINELLEKVIKAPAKKKFYKRERYER